MPRFYVTVYNAPAGPVNHIVVRDSRTGQVAPAGSLARHSRVVSSTATWSALSADGATLYDCWVSPNDNRPAPRIGTLTYGALSLADGVQHVIHSWPGMPGPQCHASLDPAGNYLLVQFPVPGPTTSGGWVLPDTLDLRTGRLAGTHPRRSTACSTSPGDQAPARQSSDTVMPMVCASTGAR